MSYNHQGKRTIAPDFDWITCDNIGFEVVANLCKLFSWMKWKKIMKHWCLNNFGVLLSFVPKNFPSRSFALPHPSNPLLSSLLAFLVLSLLFFFIAHFPWQNDVTCESLLNWIEMIVVGAAKRWKSHLPHQQSCDQEVCVKFPQKSLDYFHNLLFSTFALRIS